MAEVAWQLLLRAIGIMLVVGNATGRVLDTVTTDYGMLEGETFTLHSGEKVSRWHGVPFAAPPVGKLRFAPPEPPSAWEGVQKAHRLPNACPQMPAGLIWITQPLWGHYSEDCLYANIYAPANRAAGPYPVMFYNHGGGFISSGNIQYPGHFLAAKGVVVVVTNYRIGALGFMSTADETTPGNMGLLDQSAALRYVRDNIRHFGGDPNKVTLFGQSAGAASSSFHMFMPQSQDLFHQVICQSGSEQAMWASNAGVGHHPETYTQQIARKLNCPDQPSAKMMDCLRTKDVNDLKWTSITCNPGYFCQGFAPVVDGTTIADEPIELRRQGKFKKVKLMAGHCKDDGSLYTAFLIPETLEGGVNRTRYTTVMKENLMDMFIPRAPAYENEALRAMDFYYSDWPHLDDADRNRESLNKIITDFAFAAPSDVQAKHHSGFNDVYYYVLGYRTIPADALYGEWMGVPHNGELPYVFGWPLLQLNDEVRFDSGIAIDMIPWNNEDIEWTEYVETLWSNFAKYGNPTPRPVTAPEGNPKTMWFKYDTKNYEYLYMDRKVERRRDYRQRNIAFWHNFLPSLANYKLFPAGEPLIHPRDASAGWKTWHDSESQQKPVSTFNDTRTFSSENIQSAMVNSYSAAAMKALTNNAQKLYNTLFHYYSTMSA